MLDTGRAPGANAALGEPARHTLAEDTAWSAAASVSSLVGRLVAGIIIARRLGPEGTGQLAYLVWMADFVGTLSGLGLQNTMTRFLADVQGRGAVELTSSLARWILVRFLGLSVVGAAALAIAGAEAKEGHETLSLLCLYFLAQGIGSLYLAHLAGRQRFDISAKLNLGTSCLLVAGVLAGTWTGGVRGALAGYLAAALLPACLSLTLLRGRACTRAVGPLLRKRVWSYAVNTWLAAIVSALVWSRVEIFFIKRYWGDGDVAMFTVGLSLAGMAAQGPALLCGALMPHFAARAGAKDMDSVARTYAQATRLLALMLFPICLGVAAVTPALLPLLYGASFTPAVPSAMVLVAFSVLGVATVGSSLVYGLERSQFIAVSGLLGAALSVSACFLAIPIWGFWGAAWTRSAVQCTMIGMGFWYIARRLGFAVPFAALGRTLLAALVSAALAYFATAGSPSSWSIAVSAGIMTVCYGVIVRQMGLLSLSDVNALERLFAKMPGFFARASRSALVWIARAS